MFQELMPLLAQRRLLLMVSRVDVETISVNFIPQPLKDNKEENPALSTPLNLTGTPEELDRELPSQLIEFVGAHIALSSSLRSAKEELANAAKAAKESVKKSGAAKPSQANHSPKADPEPADDRTESDSEDQPQPVADSEPAATAAPATANLFAPTTT